MVRFKFPFIALFAHQYIVTHFNAVFLAIGRLIQKGGLYIYYMHTAVEVKKHFCQAGPGRQLTLKINFFYIPCIRDVCVFIKKSINLT